MTLDDILNSDDEGGECCDHPLMAMLTQPKQSPLEALLQSMGHNLDKPIEVGYTDGTTDHLPSLREIIQQQDALVAEFDAHVKKMKDAGLDPFDPANFTAP